jgi:predicted RNase H-like nuclease (RuvC/YqgF family)
MAEMRMSWKEVDEQLEKQWNKEKQEKEDNNTRATLETMRVLARMELLLEQQNRSIEELKQRNEVLEKKLSMIESHLRRVKVTTNLQLKVNGDIFSFDDSSNVDFFEKHNHL